MKKIIAGLLMLLMGIVHAGAQITKDPTHWTFEAQKTGDNTFNVIIKLKLNQHWHIYSFNPGGDGTLLPPVFSFGKNAAVKLDGKVKESGKLEDEDIDGVGVVHYFKNNVTYTQKITAKANTTLTGVVEYQVCDDHGCLPPQKKSFSVTIDGIAGGDSAALAAAAGAVTDTATHDTTVVAPAAPTSATEATTPAVDKNENSKAAAKAEKHSAWMLFFFALGGGLLAVLTPCIFSMIPITVSFFTKRSQNRQQGIKNAVLYSLSIIGIFTILGIAITLIFGTNALNNLSTNWIANLFFFVIFVVFGVSFLGAFEITLPSSWTNKTDSKANTNSFGGIFFMALTLVIVSFSCTGPIVGPLLVLASKGGIAGPAVGMFGFSLGLALPFSLFAIFPSILNKLGKSGGWLNSVKVTLGFIELGLAMKFLSNADLSMGWRLLDREIFIGIWIVLSFLLGLYLIGKIKFSHDSELPKNHFEQSYLTTTRLSFAIAAFAFMVYLVPGLCGAPLKGMSALLPQMGTQDWVAGGGSSSGNGGGAHAAAADPNSIAGLLAANNVMPVKYVDKLKLYEPELVKKNGMITFFDLEEAKAAAKKLKKPLMLDFTGINCVNCRKMESQVWSDGEVMKRLLNDFVVVSLYCDYDGEKLPEAERYDSKILGSRVETLGDKNEDYQATRFNSNTQPFYFFIYENDNLLAEKGYPYDPNVAMFVKHLDAVKEKYKALNP